MSGTMEFELKLICSKSMGEGIIDHCLPLGYFVMLELCGVGNRVNIFEHVTGKILFCVSQMSNNVTFSLFTP